MQQSQLNRESQTINNHFIFEEDIMGKDVILVDDSIVRGTTMINDVKYLKKVGVNSLHVFITFPPIRHPCNHAIDFHSYDELFAKDHSLDQIKDMLGLGVKDSLHYATKGDMYKAIGTKNLCNDCYTRTKC
jgi:amidophosphoribosyltransferase